MKQIKYNHYRYSILFLIAIFAVSLIFISCQPLRTTSTPLMITDNAVEGIVYYLPKHQVKVTGTATYKNSTFVNKALEFETKSVRTGVAATVTLELVRDTAYRYAFDMSPSIFYENNFTVDVNSKGFLTGFNALSTGKVGESITSVASIIGKILPMIGFLGKPEGNGKVSIDKMVQLGLISSEQRSTLFKEAYITQRYVIDSQVGRERWKELFEVNANIKAYQTEIKSLQNRLLKIVVKDIDGIEKTLTALRKELEKLQELKETIKKAFDSGLSAYKIEKKIGDVSSTYDFVCLLDPTEIPDAEKFKAGELKADVENTMREVFQCDNNSCDNLAKIWDIWTKFGILITIDPYTVTQITNHTRKKNVHYDFTIYHRQSSLHRLYVYQLGSAPEPGTQSGEICEDERLILHSSNSYQLMHPMAKPLKIGLRKNAFAKRNVILSFDSSTGSLLKFQRQDDAAFEKAAISVNTALSNSIES